METIIECRAYASAKSALDAKGADPWDTPMMQLVKEITFELAQEEIDARG